MNPLERIKVALWGRSLPRTLLRAGGVAVLCVVLFKWVLVPVRIRGMSMDPTYRDGSVNFVNALAYRLRPPDRGDVVAISIGTGGRYMYLKRLVGLPGETVSFREGRLLVDGREVSESYVKHPCRWTMKPALVGPEEVFVVGDNRSTRIESHEMGRIENRRIRGRPLW